MKMLLPFICVYLAKKADCNTKIEKVERLLLYVTTNEFNES